MIEKVNPIHPDKVADRIAGAIELAYNVGTGATNRKLGSDMADSVTGGGLHGKDLSKADVSVNIYATVDGRPYSEIVEIAKKYIDFVGGFEKFAEKHGMSCGWFLPAFRESKSRRKAKVVYCTPWSEWNMSP